MCTEIVDWTLETILAELVRCQAVITSSAVIESKLPVVCLAGTQISTAFTMLFGSTGSEYRILPSNHPWLLEIHGPKNGDGLLDTRE